MTSESEKRETLADIVAQMRGRGEDGRMDRHLWNEYADRIEAAAKREKAEAEANAFDVGGIVEAERHTPGNAAAIREALVGLTDKVLDYLHKGLIQLPLPLENATAKARAALSAPARNCDMCDSYGDAIRAFEDTEDAEEYEDMAEWLLALAAELKKEGKGDGAR